MADQSKPTTVQAISNGMWNFVKAHPRLVTSVVVISVVVVVLLWAIKGMWA